jgi:hypothetical protein
MRRALLLLAFLLAGGCYAPMGPREELVWAVREYSDGIRWNKIDQSARHLPVEKRQPFAERYGAVEDELEVVDYEVQRVEYDRKTDSAEVRVDISWSLKRRGVIERTVLQQHWEQKGHLWMLARQSVVRGTPLPLLD